MALGVSLRRIGRGGLAALLILGCTDEKIVFREPVNPPPDANSGFLGYFTATDKQSTCGNCHVGITGLAQHGPCRRLSSLANSGSAQAACYYLPHRKR